MLRILEALVKAQGYEDKRIADATTIILQELDKELTEVNFVFIPGSKLEDLTDEFESLLAEIAQEEVDDALEDDEDAEEEDDDDDYDDLTTDDEDEADVSEVDKKE